MLRRQPAWRVALFTQLRMIRKLLEDVMTAVQIDDADLAKFANAVQTEVGTLTTEFDTINTAVGVLQGYIAKLVAGQAVPLALADETAINTALTSLGTATANVGTSVTTLVGLEPPAPTPTPAPPVGP